MISVRYKIFGKVQGVSYRAFTRDKVNQLGVVGWVKNNNDGSVDCLACADRSTLGKFEKRINARVELGESGSNREISNEHIWEFQKFRYSLLRKIFMNEEGPG